MLMMDLLSPDLPGSPLTQNLRRRQSRAVSSGRWNRGEVHVDERPLVPVEVEKAAHVHEPVVFGLAQRLPTGGEGLLGEVVDLLAALGRQAEDHLSAPGRVGDLLRLDE